MLFLYQILNLVNGKRYIGITSDPDYRKWQHFTGLGSKMVFNAIKKYGLENFEFKVLICGENDYIKWLEVEKIKEWNTMKPNGYNLTVGGEGVVGYKFTDEVKQRMSKSHLGKKPTEETRKKLREWQIGRKQTKETRQKVSEGLKRYYESNKDAKRENSERQKGRKASLETRQKMSKARKGKQPTEETRQKMRAWQIGCKRPDIQGLKHPNAKRVIANGIGYGSIADAAKAMNLKHDTLKIRFLRWKKSGKFPEGFKYL